MGASYKTTKNLLPKIYRDLKEIDGTEIEVGVLKGEHAWLAHIHEYGCNIPVTPRMRAYLHYQGIHLKATTTQIVIPERSFIRAGYDKERDAVMKYARSLAAEVAEGRMSKAQFTQALGIHLSSKIKDYAVDLKSPPNSSWTVEQKGSSNPLVDTGDMIGGITWREKK